MNDNAGNIPEIDEDAAKVLAAMQQAGRPPMESLTPEQGRVAFSAMREVMKQPVPDVADVRNDMAKGPHGDIPVRLYRGMGAGDGPARTSMFFHGGGWVLGDLDTHDILCRHLANAIEGVVVAVDYRLAPEHKFPAAANDSITATGWAAGNARELGIDARRFGVMGDSAGGNLATIVALTSIKEAGLPFIRAQALIYPTTDLRMNHPSFTRVGSGYTLTANSMLWFRDHYLNEPGEVEDWRASPILSDALAKAPPAYIVTAGLDPLCDEGEAYAQAMRDAGAEVQFRCCTGQMHGFVGATGIIRQADMVIGEIGAFMKEKLG